MPSIRHPFPVRFLVERRGFMATVKIQLVIHYIETPTPVIRFAYIEKVKKEVTIRHQEHIELEAYQVENGKLKDEKILAEKIMQSSEKVEGKLKDGIHFIVDSPRVLNYSVILPKMNIKKAKQMAEKELEETFIGYHEKYSVRSFAVDAKEKGIFVYFEMLPIDLIKSFMDMSEYVDKYVDSVNLGNVSLLTHYRSCKIEQDDIIILYSDEHMTLVGLIIGQQLVETQTYYEPLVKDEALFAKIGLGIKMMSGKHEFHYERKRVQNILILAENEETKRSLEEYLKTNCNMDSLVVEDYEYAGLIQVFLQNDDYVDSIFKLDV